MKPSKRLLGRRVEEKSFLLGRHADRDGDGDGDGASAVNGDDDGDCCER